MKRSSHHRHRPHGHDSQNTGLSWKQIFVVCGVLFGVLLGLLYFFYPNLGHDQAMVVPALWELSLAWHKYGSFLVDFSPFRCLGLPHFANPNSFVGSLYHLSALGPWRESFAIGLTQLLIAGAGLGGALWLFRSLGLGVRFSLLLALGWTLQGFGVSHTLAGHVNYYQWVLLPLLLRILLEPRATLWGAATFAFWSTHLLFTSGYYILLIGWPSLLVALWMLNELMPSLMRERNLGSFSRGTKNFLLYLPGMVILGLPKIFAVLDFTSQYPREVALDRIGLGSAFLYTLSHYVWPFPYDVRGMTAWWYGNWESYEFIFPGLLWCFIFWWISGRRNSSWKKWIGMGVGILVCGTLLSSGILGPLFQKLPILKSLHVNPRWNAFVLLPFTCWLVGGCWKLGKTELSRPVFWGLLLLALITPFFYLDQENMQIRYPDRAGIAFDRERAQFCYEPIFGYGLETFPLNPRTDWFSEDLVDPRCYLKSYGCRPGTFFRQEGREEDALKLKHYVLRDDNHPLKKAKGLLWFLYACCGIYFVVGALGRLRTRQGS